MKKSVGESWPVEFDVSWAPIDNEQMMPGIFWVDQNWEAKRRRQSSGVLFSKIYQILEVVWI